MTTKTAVKTKTEIRKGELIKRFLYATGATFVGIEATTECRMNKGGRGGVAVNRLHGQVVKKSRVGGGIGMSYENLVNNARLREAKADISSLVFKFADDIVNSMLAFGISPNEIEAYETDMTDEIRRRASETVEDNVEEFKAAERKWGKHMQNGVEFDIETCKMRPTFSKTVIEHEKDDERRFYLQLFVFSTQTPTYHYVDSGDELSDDDLEYIKTYFPKKSESRQGLRNPIIVRDYRFDNLDTITVNKTEYTITE